jgi:hypothetical protein
MTPPSHPPRVSLYSSILELSIRFQHESVDVFRAEVRFMLLFISSDLELIGVHRNGLPSDDLAAETKPTGRANRLDRPAELPEIHQAVRFTPII